MSIAPVMTTNVAEQLRRRIEQRTARIGVVGLGYVGLPTATAFAEAGFPVVGIDRNAQRWKSVAAGRSHIDDVPAARVSRLVEQGTLTAVPALSRAGDLDIIDICVPTPLDKSRDPDVSAILSVINELRPLLRRGQLIVLTSTAYPGTTAELLQQPLEALGFTIGTDVFVAFAPERIDPGNTRFTLRNTPKVVGGATPACSALAVQAFETIVDEVVPVSSPTAAEMAKLLENTFRSVNIALANEVAVMCRHLGLDVWEVIDAAATKPYGFMPFYPGPGLGGHCIPVDPSYLSWKLRRLNYHARFVGLAEDINRHMPQHVVQRAADILNDSSLSLRNARILLLGVAYKPDVDDLRESPALDILALLQERGASVAFTDPHVQQPLNIGAASLKSLPLNPELLGEQDLVILTTAHSAFDRSMVMRHSPRLLDTRGWMPTPDRVPDRWHTL